MFAAIPQLVRPGSVQSVTGIGNTKPLRQDEVVNPDATDHIPFDLKVIRTIPGLSPPGGSVLQLIGPDVSNSQSATAPSSVGGWTFVLRQIATYIEAHGGALPPGLIPTNATFQVTWRVTGDRRTAGQGMVITNEVSAPWSDPGTVPILYLPQGVDLRISVHVNDPDHLYTRIGVRARGYLARLGGRPPE